MNTEDLIKQKRDEILNVSRKHGAHNVRIFGSAVRGEATPESDIDFLVDLESGRSLLDMGGLLMDLERILNRKVDIVTPNGLHWFIKDQILKEARPI